MKIVLLAGRRSGYAGRAVRAIVAAGVELSAVVVVSRRWRDALRMFRSAGRSAGWTRTAGLAVRRFRAERRTRAIPIPNGIPVLVCGPTNSAETICRLREIGPDVVALAQPGIVGPGILAAASRGVVNAHPGSLPRYRGLDPGRWAVLAGDVERVGASVHWVNRGVDTGPVISFRRLEQPLPADPDALDDRLEELAAVLLAETLAALVRGDSLEARPQLPSEARYHGKMDRHGEAAVARLLRPPHDPAAPLSGKNPCAS